MCARVTRYVSNQFAFTKDIYNITIYKIKKKIFNFFQQKKIAEGI